MSELNDETQDERERERSLIVPLAIAEYFGCSPDEIGAWAVVCERSGPAVHSIWSGSTHWLLLGLVGELRNHLEALRSQAGDATMMRRDGDGT